VSIARREFVPWLGADLANAAGRSNLLRVRELTPGLRAGDTFILSAGDLKAA
jgi:hypothetical protein